MRSRDPSRRICPHSFPLSYVPRGHDHQCRNQCFMPGCSQGTDFGGTPWSPRKALGAISWRAVEKRQLQGSPGRVRFASGWTRVASCLCKVRPSGVGARLSGWQDGADVDSCLSTEGLMGKAGTGVVSPKPSASSSHSSCPCVGSAHQDCTHTPSKGLGRYSWPLQRQEDSLRVPAAEIRELQGMRGHSPTCTFLSCVTPVQFSPHVHRVWVPCSWILVPEGRKLRKVRGPTRGLHPHPIEDSGLTERDWQTPCQRAVRPQEGAEA